MNKFIKVVLLITSYLLLLNLVILYLNQPPLIKLSLLKLNIINSTLFGSYNLDELCYFIHTIVSFFNNLAIILLSLLLFTLLFLLLQPQKLGLYDLKYKNYFVSAFSGKNYTIYIYILYFIINIIVFINFILHNPAVGYDTSEHMKNAIYLSRFSWPTSQESGEFFSPPLPYIVPAIFYILFKHYISQLIQFQQFPDILTIAVIGKGAQMANIFLSIGLTFFLLKICQIVRPDNGCFKFSTIILLTILPVYYKTFAQARPEPYVAFFYIFIIYQILKLRENINNKKRQVGLGVSLGLLILSRQWGFFLILSLILFYIIQSIKYKHDAIKYLKALIIIFFLICVTGGWFYAYLFIKYGSITAFNTTGFHVFSFYNQPQHFYFDFSFDKLFSSPIRPNFNNRFFPIIYSETWGDYWAYFLVSMKKLSTHSIHQLALQNILGLYPTMLFIIGVLTAFLYSIRFYKRENYNNIYEFNILLLIIVFTTIIFYGYFVINTPTVRFKGDTIKATYIIYIYPCLCFFGGEVFNIINYKNKKLYIFLLVGILCVAILIFPGLFSRRWLG